ncbi:hypothetical protein [Sphingomonas sp. 67-41]|uniref:hypothetical protein n=1 Tax=Sphingomonas TaxID=13687 RepID=UPI0009678994|nr:hypothetical protein [Sphingomonas sp. 67-41]OJY51492.1 MAG: hypothetical protein BGP17_13810 [Sphingomonas sp. 67-41]
MNTEFAAVPQHDAQNAEELMAAYGIECVPVAYFHWNGYRYTTLKDAVAAAKRAAAGGSAAGA